MERGIGSLVFRRTPDSPAQRPSQQPGFAAPAEAFDWPVLSLVDLTTVGIDADVPVIF